MQLEQLVSMREGHLVSIKRIIMMPSPLCVEDVTNSLRYLLPAVDETTPPQSMMDAAASDDFDALALACHLRPLGLLIK